jgi:hypothetical protein
MSLVRLLLIGFAVWLVLRFLKNWNVQVTRREHNVAPPPPAAERDALELRACPRCGVRVPASELAGNDGCERCRATR